MKFLPLLFFFFAMFALTLADDTCVSDGKTLKKDELYKPDGECKLYKCNGKELEVEDICRPILQLDYKCPKTEEDVTKPFPDCCARYDCSP